MSRKTIRRIVLSTFDFMPTLKKCETMMCSDGGIEEGMTIDLDADERVNYWFVAKASWCSTQGPLISPR